MKPGIPYCPSLMVPLVWLAFALSMVGCKAGQLTTNGTNIVFLYDEPAGCENLGVVIGQGGGMTGAYSKPSVIRESAENDARNKAAERGATHLLLHPEELAQGDGRGPTEQDTAPAMAHGSGTGSTVTVAGTAFKCALDAPPAETAMSIQGAGDAPPAETAMSIQGAGAFVAVQAPTSISLAPLGQLKSITVFHRMPLPSGTGMGETEVLKVEEQAEMQRVVDSLRQVAEDPMKYIPTHRVELVGELGVQSLLYGFGYLQYAGSVYRLTTGDFETVLKL
ncbi:MAG: DUF4156 domain-containing protein, partial [Deltaproteobacteria bacterium]|nr:DUF4156 domain-containing protein [Deltaproteobacteria bacterium]